MFQFDLRDHTGGDVGTGSSRVFDVGFLLSHDDALDPGDLDLGYSAGHDALNGPFTDDQISTVVLHSDQPGGSRLVSATFERPA